MKSWILTLLCVGLFGLAAGPAFGQQMHYTPATPTMSPWMNMFQSNTGPLDNYNTFVRPRIQLRNTLDQQNQAIDRQAASIYALQNETAQPGTAQRTAVHPTGVNASFMNYSHYFPNSTSAISPVGRATVSSVGRPSVVGVR
jgi:hypothetical protein